METGKTGLAVTILMDSETLNKECTKRVFVNWQQALKLE